MLSHLAHGPYRVYFLRSFWAFLRRARRACPCCGARSCELVARKMAVTALVRCQSCKLLYRIPTDSPGFSESQYQEDYTAGVYSDVPSQETIRELVATRFVGSERDYGGYIRALRAIGVGAGARVLEFGASWGYGTWQLQDAGYDAVGFELGKARARSARELLGVRVEDDLDKIDGQFDVFFSSHVLEHFPNPRQAFELATRLVKPGGLFVAVTPNGSFEYLKSGKTYHANWGMYHPVYLDEVFYQHAFPRTPILVTSKLHDVERLHTWDRKQNLLFDLCGPELLLVYVVR